MQTVTNRTTLKTGIEIWEYTGETAACIIGGLVYIGTCAPSLLVPFLATYGFIDSILLAALFHQKPSTIKDPSKYPLLIEGTHDERYPLAAGAKIIMDEDDTLSMPTSRLWGNPEFTKAQDTYKYKYPLLVGLVAQLGVCLSPLFYEAITSRDPSVFHFDALTPVLPFLYSGFAIKAATNLIAAINEYYALDKKLLLEKGKSVGQHGDAIIAESRASILESKIKNVRLNMLAHALDITGWSLLAASNPVGWICIALATLIKIGCGLHQSYTSKEGFFGRSASTAAQTKSSATNAAKWQPLVNST